MAIKQISTIETQNKLQLEEECFVAQLDTGFNHLAQDNTPNMKITSQVAIVNTVSTVCLLFIDRVRQKNFAR